MVETCKDIIWILKAVTVAMIIILLVMKSWKVDQLHWTAAVPAVDS